MAQVKTDDRSVQSVNKEEQAPHEGLNLKGTLVSVFILGIFIIVSWLGVWALFLAR